MIICIIICVSVILCIFIVCYFSNKPNDKKYHQKLKDINTLIDNFRTIHSKACPNNNRYVREYTVSNDNIELLINNLLDISKI